MSHLFIDEAAQATEPATLIPVCGLLAPNGLLVLAGDPQQLGPVCISKEARDRGLGVIAICYIDNKIFIGPRPQKKSFTTFPLHIRSFVKKISYKIFLPYSFSHCQTNLDKN